MAVEYDIYKAVAGYMRHQYPNNLWHFDLAGVSMSKAQAGKTKAIQRGRGFPDLQILEPRGGFNGLFLEIKRNGERIFKKDGTFASEHILEQADWLNGLRLRGYKAEFAVGFDECKTIIDAYFAQK